MLIQLHHQFIKQNKLEFCAQRDIETHEDMRVFVKEMYKTFPLPEGAQWLAVTEESKHFIKTHGEPVCQN